jgi:hypothetical protein
MIRVSLSYIFELATRIDRLEFLPDKDTPWQGVWHDFYVAKIALDELYSQTPYAPHLRSSATLASQLSKIIEAQVANPDPARVLDQFTLWNVGETYRKFKLVLLADLGVLHSYFVSGSIICK